MATTRCSSCYSYGHNKRGCPVLKERAAIAAAKPAADRSYSESRAMERVAEFKQSAANRSCSYCGDQKHNIAGCNIRKADIVTATDSLVTWRKTFVEQAKNCGFGIGAVIKHNHYSTTDGYARDDAKKNNSPADNFHYRLVAKFVTENLNYWNKNGEDVFQGKTFSEFGINSRYSHDSCYIPDEIRRSVGMRDGYYITLIVSPVSSIGIDEAKFVSKFECQQEIQTLFNKKDRKKKCFSRSELIYNGTLSNGTT